MKYWKIILFGFLIGCLLSLAGLIILRRQQPEPTYPHHGNDMESVAYGLAIGFNMVLALCSLPVLVASRYGVKSLWRGAIWLFGLPIAFTAYTTIALDAYALLYCIPYLLAVTVLFKSMQGPCSIADHCDEI